jgi:hypothetical protein
MYALGVLIAIGAAVAFAAIGAFTLWGGFDALTSEVPRGFRRSATAPARRALTIALVGFAVLATGLFGLLAAGRVLQIALGLG